MVWLDAHADDSWHDDLDDKPRECRTVGYLIAENKEAVVLAGMLDVLDDPPTYACTMTIPKVTITSAKAYD